MPFLEKRLLFPLQTTLTIAAFLRGNNFNQSWCILRYHPAVLQPKTRWRWEKIIPSWLGIIMNLGEWNNLWSNCCSALKRCHPYNRNEWNQISPSSKFLKYNIYIYGWFGVYFLMIPLGVSQSQERSPWTEKRALKWQLIALWIIWSHIATLGYTPNQPSLQKLSERRGDGKTQFPSIFLGGPSKIFEGGKLTKPAGCPLSFRRQAQKSSW